MTVSEYPALFGDVEHFLTLTFLAFPLLPLSFLSFPFPASVSVLEGDHIKSVAHTLPYNNNLGFIGIAVVRLARPLEVGGSLGGYKAQFTSLTNDNCTGEGYT